MLWCHAGPTLERVSNLARSYKPCNFRYRQIAFSKVALCKGCSCFLQYCRERPPSGACVTAFACSWLAVWRRSTYLPWRVGAAAAEPPWRRMGTAWQSFPRPWIASVTFQNKPLRGPIAIFWDRQRSLPRYAKAFCDTIADYMKDAFPVTRPSEPTRGKPRVHGR